MADINLKAKTPAAVAPGFLMGAGAMTDAEPSIYPIERISEVPFAFNSSDTANSLAHKSGLAVGDTFRVRYFDSNMQDGSSALWRVWQVSGTTTPGTIGNGGSANGITMEGTGGAKLVLVAEPGSVVDPRMAGIICDGVTPINLGRFALVAAACKARGLKLVNHRLFPMRITQTVDVDNFDCDLTFQAGNPAEKVISAITKANPAVVTSVKHGLSNGKTVLLYGASGMTQVNGQQYVVANVTTDTFELQGIDSTGFGTYTAGGKAQVVGLGDFYAGGNGVNLAATFTNANPGVVTTASNHGLSADAEVKFAVDKLGVLPPNVNPLVSYYVLAAGLTANSFQIATSPGGAAISTVAAAGINPGSGAIYCFIPPAAVAGYQTADMAHWNGMIKRKAFAVRAAFSPGVSNGQCQKITVKGDGGYDFTTESTCIGILANTDDSPHSDLFFRAAYCYVGHGIAGPFEKKRVNFKASYCEFLAYDLYGSSADTVEIVLSGTKYRHIYYEADGPGSSVNITLYCEGRVDPGSDAPAIFVRNGKYTSIGGVMRAHEGLNNIIVDKPKQFGADTLEFKNLHVVHAYGRQIVVNRVRHVTGKYHLHDIAKGPNASGTDTSAVVELNRIMSAGELSGYINDCSASIGLQIGQTDGFYSREVNFGRHSIKMGTSNLPIRDDNTDNPNANAWPTGTVALSVLKAKGGSVEISQCAGDIVIGPQVVASNGVAFKVYVPEDQKRYSRTIDAAANAVIGWTPLVDHASGKLPLAVIPDVSGDPAFIEAVQDIIGALVRAGTGISVNYDDAAATLTITASAGEVAADDLNLAAEYTDTSPTAPTAGVTVFSRKRAGRRRLATRSPGGNRSSSVQAFLGTNKARTWTAAGNGTTVSNVGLQNSTGGTVTARNVANTNDFTMFSRVGYIAASAAANTTFGVRHGALQFLRANAAAGKNAGFEFVSRWGMSVVDANLGRIAVGMFSTSSALPSADPVNLTNCVFIGKDDGDANLSIYSNDASGTCTKTSLGSSFPGNTANSDMYETRFFCEPNGDRIFWSIENLVTGAFAEGAATTDIPAATVLLGPQIWANTGTSVVAMGIDVVSQYVETDF